MTTNYAKFMINGAASVDSDNNAGVNVTNGQTLTLTLETNPAPVLSETYQVYDANDSSSPTKSKDAPLITFTGSSTSTEVLQSPNDSVTIDMPNNGVHSYVIRCTTSIGGTADDHVYERLVAIQSATVPAIRKTVPNETNQYDQDGWSDELNDMVDVLRSVAGGFFDDFYGDAVSSAWTQTTSGTGTVSIPAAATNSVGGVCSLYINRDGSPNTSIIDVSAFQFDSNLRPTFKAYFKISTISEIICSTGFYQTPNDYIVLDVDSATSGNFRFKANRGSSPTFEDTGIALDTDWHTVEILLNGLGNDAELMFDGDTSNIFTLASGSIPSTQWFGLNAQQTATTSSAGASSFLIDYIGATQQRRTS